MNHRESHHDFVEEKNPDEIPLDPETWPLQVTFQAAGDRQNTLNPGWDASPTIPWE